MMQVVTVLGETATDAARDHIEALKRLSTVIVPLAAKHAVLLIDGITLVWERHTE